MKLKISLLFCLMTCCVIASAEFYELKIYTIKNTVQQKRMDDYLKNAYIPAAHRLGIQRIGVFKPLESDTAAYGKLVYVLTPLKSLDQLLELPELLSKDASYRAEGTDYLDADYQHAPYARIQRILLSSFEDAPFLQLTAHTNAPSERVYELRSYESQTEKIHQNKVKMFNAGGEVTLFKDLGFNAVFYGAVISGANMPNLMYMTTFENMDSRNAHWKAFDESPVWKKLRVDPEYKNNVSKNTSFFLCPTDYSDI